MPKIRADTKSREARAAIASCHECRYTSLVLKISAGELILFVPRCLQVLANLCNAGWVPLRASTGSQYKFVKGSYGLSQAGPDLS